MVSHALCTKDTFFGSMYSKGPNGGALNLTVGGWGDIYVAFFQFNLTGSPSSANTVTAHLAFYTTHGGNANPVPLVYRLTSPWDEATCQYGSAPSRDSGTSWGPLTYTTGWQYVDITTLYKSWKDGVENLGVTIRPTFTNNNNMLSIKSRENAGLEPYILVQTPPKTTGLASIINVNSITF